MKSIFSTCIFLRWIKINVKFYFDIREFREGQVSILKSNNRLADSVRPHLRQFITQDVKWISPFLIRADRVVSALTVSEAHRVLVLLLLLLRPAEERETAESSVPFWNQLPMYESFLFRFVFLKQFPYLTFTDFFPYFLARLNLQDLFLKRLKNKGEGSIDPIHKKTAMSVHR